MTHDQIITAVAAIVTTLAETNGGPESSIYCALGCDIERWNKLRQLLVASNLVTLRSNWVELTDKGRTLAADCNAAMANS